MTVSMKVWWIPQVPMEPFEWPIKSIEQGEDILDLLAAYDMFQYENNIKPDYCNTGGIVWMHPEVTEGEWWDIGLDDREEGSDFELIKQLQNQEKESIVSA